jgi:dCMP deaminase
MRRNTMFKEHWYMRFLMLAKHVSEWSKDPSTKCGAIIVDRYGTVISQGYNGFARGMADTIERYENRDFKYDHVIHAEMNAIINARQPIDDHILFVWPMLPCIRCAAVVAQSNVREVVSAEMTLELRHRWGLSVLKSKQLFNETGIIVREMEI